MSQRKIGTINLKKMNIVYIAERDACRARSPISVGGLKHGGRWVGQMFNFFSSVSAGR